MIQIILAVAAFYYGVYGTIWLVGSFFWLVSNGFNFRKTSREMEFGWDMIREREAQKKQDDKRSQEEYLAKRRERLGY